jgi:hypothetical protein
MSRSLTLEDLARTARQAAAALELIADALSEAARGNGATPQPARKAAEGPSIPTLDVPPPPPPATRAPVTVDAKRTTFSTVTFAEPETCANCLRRIAIGQIGLTVDDYSAAGGWVGTRSYHMTCDPRRPALARSPGPNVRGGPAPPEDLPADLTCRDCPERESFATLAALKSHRRSRHP